MKVLLVEPWSNGGTAKYVACAAKALVASGCEVDLLVPEGFDYDPPGIDRCLTGPALGSGSSSRVRNLGRLVLWRRRFQSCLNSHVQSTQYSVVHVMNPSLGTRSLAVRARSAGSALAVTIHDLPTRRRTRGFDVGGADVAFVHGLWSQKQLVNLYPELRGRIVRIPLGAFDFGVPTDTRVALRDRFGLPHDSKVVLFFGSIRRNKGLDVLIRSVGLDDQLHLFVVGSRPARSEPSPDEYRAVSDRLGQGRSTWIEAYVPDRDVADIFEVADVVAIPYLEGFAGQSAVLATAIGHRRPVVASRVAELTDLVERGHLGEVVPPGDSVALHRALVEVANRAYRPDESYLADQSWAAHSRVTVAAYRSAVSQSLRRDLNA